jgi:hypothetical protein
VKKTIILSCILILLLFITGCAGAEPESVPAEPTSQLPFGQEANLSYPPPETSNEVESGYPINELTFDYPEGPEFHIDTPVSHNDLMVTGNGPANVPIRLVNVSEVGVVLAETVIDETGNFVLTLDQPLISGHSIGLQLGDIENTEFEESQFVYSETYFDRPFVGILFDLVVVE